MTSLALSIPNPGQLQVWLGPAATLMGTNAGDAAEAAADRLLALPISSERVHGIFEEKLPKGYRSGEAAARAIDDLDVWSQALMVHCSLQAGRKRYGPGTPRERHND